MQEINVDVAIIGAGTAGMTAYASAANRTDRLVLIEGGAFGTTCARVGCMPSKLLIAAAEAAHRVNQAALFGLCVSGFEIDGAAVMSRVRTERDRFVGYALEEIESIPEDRVLRGTAQFESADSLLVGDQFRVNAGAWVIATGSKPFIPEELRGLGERIIGNDEIFDWQKLPRSLIMVGTGVIAIESGQALARLGVEVTFLARGNRVGSFTDPELQEAARTILGSELRLMLNSRIKEAKCDESGVRLRVEQGGQLHELEADYVFAATGRIPALEDLQIERTGISLNEKGYPEHDPFTLRCGDSNVFVAGDVTGFLPLQHEAVDEGRLAGANAANFPDVQAGNRRAHLNIVFSDPQVALIGKRYCDLKPGSYVSGRVSFANQGRSRIIGQNQGLLKIYADRVSGQLLGAEMIGPAAEHLGHLLAWAQQNQLTLLDLLGLPFYHPTIEEALRTAVSDCRRSWLAQLPLGDGSTGMQA